LLQLYIPEEKDKVLQSVKNADSQRSCCRGNFRQVKKNGEEMDVEIFSTYLVIDERPCCTIIAVDVTEKNMAELKLTQAIIKTQEEERYAIGSELHDNVCQILVGSIMNLSFVLPSLNDEKSEILSTGINHIKKAATEIRNLSHRLAPAFFDDVQLRDSLLHLLSSINVGGRFKTYLMYDKKIESIDLNRDLQINLYRILQEQLNNIIKHAEATIINVGLSLDSGNLLFEIKDNGVGFTQDIIYKGIGFANMTRRAKLFSGSFAIDASPGNGCKITIVIPEERLT
jgi:signal transduction histidine kinase